MKIFIETERLILREILPTDVDGLFELDSDPEVHQYLGNNPVKNKDQIVDVIQHIRQQYIDNGIGRWAVVDKATHEFIGWSGLKLVRESTNQHINFYDIGYRLIKKHWGKGYATETTLPVLKYGFNTLNLNEIYGMCDVENKGSKNVLEKSGLTFLETFELDGAAIHWYKITRDTFYSKLKEKGVDVMDKTF